MRNKRCWKQLMALMMGAMLFVTAPTAWVKAEEPEEAAAEKVVAAAGADIPADENGFVIVDGVLQEYSGAGGDVTIPKGVTRIGMQAFHGCNLTSVTIPEGVTRIGAGAFSNNSRLTSVTIPEGVTIIEDGAFRDCSSLTSLTLPKGVTSIGMQAFSDCSSLTSVTLPKGVASIGRQAFRNCSSLTSVTIPEGVRLGSEMFEECIGLTSVTISEGVTIARDAFLNCSNLKSAVISENVQIMTGAFSGSGCFNLTIYGKEGSSAESYARKNGIPFVAISTAAELSNCTITINPSSYAYDGKEKKPDVTVRLGSATLVEKKDYSVSYENNKNIGTASVTITGLGDYKGTVKKDFEIVSKKGTTVSSGAYKYKFTGTSEVAFAGLSSTKTAKVTIPAKVTIGGKNFKVTSIEAKALQKKTKVTSITIGANVKTIGSNAFNGCKKLKTITIKSTKLTKTGKNAFKGISQTAKIKVPKAKLKAYQKLLKGKGQGGKVKITK